MSAKDDRKNAPGAGSDPTKRKPRAGWAEAFQEIAEAGDDALVWPEFPNQEDADLIC
jgi:hypothetical protein